MICDLWFMIIITTIITITSISITRSGAVLWYCAIATWQPLIEFPQNNLSVLIPNKDITSNTSSPHPYPHPHYHHQLIMVLTSSACFWFSTSSSLILWSFKLLRPKICQSWPCFLTHSAQHRIVNPKKVFKTPETKNLSVPALFFLTKSVKRRTLNSRKAFQTPEDQNLFDCDPTKSGNVTSLEPLARFSSPPFLKRIFWKSFYCLIYSIHSSAFCLQWCTLSKLLNWFHLWQSFQENEYISYRNFTHLPFTIKGKAYSCLQRTTLSKLLNWFHLL